MSKIKSELENIFDRYYDKRICVLGNSTKPIVGDNKITEVNL